MWPVIFLTVLAFLNAIIVVIVCLLHMKVPNQSATALKDGQVWLVNCLVYTAMQQKTENVLVIHAITTTDANLCVPIIAIRAFKVNVNVVLMDGEDRIVKLSDVQDTRQTVQAMASV